jgi:hypothetical protein
MTVATDSNAGCPATKTPVTAESLYWPGGRRFRYRVKLTASVR